MLEQITWEMAKVPLAVFGTDILMWLNWAFANDLSISKYEWRILLDRVMKFGTAGVLLVMLGMGWDKAAALAGLGVFGDAWIKSLKPDVPSPPQEKTISTI
jgi:hypothetical protein